jgi:hypothetical protein
MSQTAFSDLPISSAISRTLMWVQGFDNEPKLHHRPAPAHAQTPTGESQFTGSPQDRFSRPAREALNTRHGCAQTRFFVDADQSFVQLICPSKWRAVVFVFFSLFP